MLSKLKLITTAFIVGSAVGTAFALEGEQTNPDVPVGSLDVDQMIIREGLKPNLSWNVVYPKGVLDIVDIDTDSDEVTTKKRLWMDVKVLGASVADQNGRFYPVRLYFRPNGNSGWNHLGTMTNSQVKPSKSLYSGWTKEGDTLSVAGRVSLRGYPYYYNNGNNVEVLKNGDSLPMAAQYEHQLSYEDFIKPYVKDNKVVLGPNEVIYLMELTHTKEKDMDRQDAVILVSFTEEDDNGESDSVEGANSNDPG